MRYEFYKILYDKKKWIIIIFFISCICFDAYLGYKDSFLYVYNHDPHYPIDIVRKFTNNPPTAAFFSTSTRGHLMQEIIIWALPLYFLFLCSDSYVAESKRNYFQLIQIRNKKSIVKDKLFFSFLLGFGLMSIGLLLNFILCLIIFKSGLHQNESAGGMPSILSNASPYVAYIIYILLASIISGLLNMTMTAASFILKYKIPLYAISFLVWYYLIIYKYSITYVLQPFIEYGMDYLIPSIVVFICICIVTNVLLIWRRKHEAIFD